MVFSSSFSNCYGPLTTARRSGPSNLPYVPGHYIALRMFKLSDPLPAMPFRPSLFDLLIQSASTRNALISAGHLRIRGQR
jgi:hypothetical protein